MGNEGNLRPCKPGHTNNPHGRPKGLKNVKTIIKKYLALELLRENGLTKQPEKLKVEEHIVLAALAKAMNGDDRSREDMFNRLYGKPKETVENINANFNVDIPEEDLDQEISKYLELREHDSRPEDKTL